MRLPERHECASEWGGRWTFKAGRPRKWQQSHRDDRHQPRLSSLERFLYFTANRHRSFSVGLSFMTDSRTRSPRRKLFRILLITVSILVLALLAGHLWFVHNARS